MSRPVAMTPGTLFFKDELPFYVNRVEESFRLEFHAHDFMEIAYIDEGAGFHYVNDETLPVSKGDLFLLPIGVSHVFRPKSVRPEQPLVVYNCIYKQEQVAAALTSMPGFAELARASRLLQLAPPDPHSEHAPRFLRDRTGVFGELLRAMHLELAQRRVGYAARLYALFAELAVALERHSEPDAATPFLLVETDEDPIREAIRVADASFAEPLTAAALAARLNVSARHFHRLFRAATGRTFNDYVQQRRVERAAEWLAGTRWSVQDIAGRAGYQDVKFFQRLFKKKTGHSPREYRRLHSK
ncbi:MAG TPA: AraC family transcriptional regulator [Paenibacillus sp.]|nr:AraC family transcriptional regulator [Paenibacillus sp.]